MKKIFSSDFLFTAMISKHNIVIIMIDKKKRIQGTFFHKVNMNMGVCVSRYLISCKYWLTPEIKCEFTEAKQI